MKNDLFEKAKQAVAEKHGFDNWDHAMFIGNRETFRSFYAESTDLYAKWIANEAVKAYFTFRPVDEWEEEMGDCLFYKTPMCEAPIVTCPLSSDWIDGYFTHFLEMKKFPVPDEDGNAIPGNSRNKYWLPFPPQPDGI